MNFVIRPDVDYNKCKSCGRIIPTCQVYCRECEMELIEIQRLKKGGENATKI